VTLKSASVYYRPQNLMSFLNIQSFLLVTVRLSDFYLSIDQGLNILICYDR